MKILARLAAVTVALLTLCMGSMASAQSNGLGITPRKDYTIKAGGQVADKLFINNLSQKDDLHLQIRVVDFRAQDETGTPALELAANAQQTPWSLKPFMKIANTLTIPAGKSVYLPFTVSIPANQGAGSYYSAIEYVAQNSQAQQRVNIAASSASLVFVTVPGKANEQLVFKQFGTFVPSSDDETGSFKSFFVGSPPKTLAYRLQNNGNVAENPQGSILIKNIFGKTVKTIAKANPKNELALLGQTRRFEVCMKDGQTITKASNGQSSTQTVCKDPGLLPGRYTAQLAVFYGLNGSNTQEVTATSSFLYLPWWSFAVLVLLIVIVAAAVRLIMRKTGRGKKPAASSARR